MLNGEDEGKFYVCDVCKCYQLFVFCPREALREVAELL